MKKLLFLLLAVASFTLANAQDRWTVQLNSKTLLTANQEDTITNVISVKDLKKGSFLLTYTSGKIDSRFGRRIAIYDESDNELYSKESANIAIPVARLKKWKKNHSQLKIYTWPISKDPGLQLKVRRVHLCTINFN